MNVTHMLRLCTLVGALSFTAQAEAQIVLIGDNAPHGVMNDGDFSAVWKGWRTGDKSPFWDSNNTIQAGKTLDATMGMDYGRMFSARAEGIAQSHLLNNHPEYTQPKVGDVMHWSFKADLEYISKGTLSFALVFGEQERMLAERVTLVGSDKTYELFSGQYTLTAEDAAAGHPYIRVYFYSEADIKVYLDDVRIWVEAPHKKAPQLTAQVGSGAINLSWSDDLAQPTSVFNIYRQVDPKSGYDKIGETQSNTFSDSKLITGRPYSYIVTRQDGEMESGASNVEVLACKDKVAPQPPTQVETTVYDSEIKLTWQKSVDNDVASYSIFRGDAEGNNMEQIVAGLPRNWFEDILAPKGVNNTYVVYAHDYSGNRSEATPPIQAKVNIINGASFSDLILPMPVGEGLTRAPWGAEGVQPRDMNNGIESPDWTYWGGRPTYDPADGKYHMLVTRWPETALKGHWEWSKSTVAHSVSDNPIGPYRVVRDIAYDYHDGLGHNPDIIKLNDGTFALYSLIDWDATIFTAPTMSGPWKREGILTVNWQDFNPDDKRDYQYYRNLSGVQLEDGSILMVSKFGAMMISKNGLLGPYEVLTHPVSGNLTIPERYRKSAYEDPVMWRDEVQFHLLINAFIDKRAIYLRSGDGVNWVFDPGLAYTEDFTTYENGVKNHWYKLERPHVLQDEYGRATVLSLAVIDVPKELEYGNDNHNSKNLMIPLRVTRRIEMLNKKPIDEKTRKITIVLKSEEGFDATKDVDLSSLRFGAASEVNYGRGSKAIKSKRVGKDLRIEFDGEGNGMQASDFACKLIGKTKSGDLIVGYSKIIAD